jgi:hypothetical protein
LSNETLLAVYPGTLTANALEGDVTVASDFTLFPSPRGTLELLAGKSVQINGAVKLSDLDPRSLPQPQSAASTLQFKTTTLELSYFDARTHALTPLHTGDSEPVRIYAAGGDVELNSFAPMFFGKALDVRAARDISINTQLVAQNVTADDVTRLQGGRDVSFPTQRDASNQLVSNDSRIVVGGPGRLDVLAGRTVDLGNSAGMITRGNLDNAFLPDRGAAIGVLAGLGVDSSGGLRRSDYSGFIDKYISAADATRSYLPELTAYMRGRTGSTQLTPEQALSAYLALDRASQVPFAEQVFFTELQETGRAAISGAGYDRGYRAISVLLPAETYAGDIKLFFSQIKSERGGDIRLFAPGGSINAGLANPPGGFAKLPSELGIVTVRGGDIQAIVRNDFLVNQSRVFTLQGGDILLWSSEGNIDAGKGAKSATAAPPPVITVDANGNVKTELQGTITGAGIGVLLTVPGLKPGNVDLIAPRGEVNAGDAGIRVAGNLTIAALRVVGADNIQVGGAAAGVPIVPSTTLAAATAGVANAASDASKAAEQATQQLASKTDLSKTSFLPSFISVELLGLGEDEEPK